ncbi:MAG: hypothetical protein QM809_15710 [Gordonia sp. (in: high G+C Gram-positive bacteria)]|uniref:DUF6891 domain-containing protein n=1 Tax=Gordonia sp. (in: high G+C Gram-positive bacteria) TaxID=84139 RepID=UPI0039E2D0BB
MSIDHYARPDGYALPVDWDLGEDAEYVEEQTWQQVLHGENDVEVYLDYFEDELAAAEISADRAAAWFRSVIEARRDQQARWGLPLPVTALDRAFAELNDTGIVARGDFTCCGTCGSAEIVDERDDSREWKGYVFFHQQDTDGIFQDRTTYLNYGAFLPAFFTQSEWEGMSDAERDREYARVTVGLMNDVVVPVFRRHGIGVDWGGDLNTRIRLTDVDFLAPMAEPE